MSACEHTTPAPERDRWLVLASVAALGCSCVMTQLALLRELLGAFSGNEMVLGAGLGLWLLLMGLGTALGRRSERLRHPIAALGALQVLLAVLPLVQVFLLRALRNRVFLRGAEAGLMETVAATLVLLLPYCLAGGFALTLACSLLARREGPAGIGSGYVADCLGSVLGGLLFSLVLVRFFDHLALLIFPALFNLLAAAALCFCAAKRPKPPDAGWHGRWRSALLFSTLALAAALITTASLINLDAVSTRLQYPKQNIVARANSPYGKVIVTEADGQFDVLENGVSLTSTRDEQHVEETVHYPMSQRPKARQVLLIGGGISGTAKEVLKYDVREVDYVELDPRVLELGQRFLSENLADGRIRVFNTDGRLFVQAQPPLEQAARDGRGKYDVIIVDTAAPSTAQLNRFYTVEFFIELKRVLSDGGVVSCGLGGYENYVSPDLARMLASLQASLKAVFRNVSVLPGSRVYFLASDGPLFADIAGRIERDQIKTKLVNRHYLEAMLSPDRLADMTRAVNGVAALNRDFSPILYYYHLRHWMSQFDFRVGPLQAGLLMILAIYLVRLRGSTLVLFASGFAASSLEFVLLLAFQVLCGSVYRQVGIIVTVFMAGLAVGAGLVKKGEGGSVKGEQGRGGRTLAWLAFAIAAYAALLPLGLPLVGKFGSARSSLLAVRVLLALLTLLLAVVVGMQFPLANRLDFRGTASSVSRLYTADFVGAFLGALLASTLLVPLIGVWGVCLVTAGLNLVAGLAGYPRTAQLV